MGDILEIGQVVFVAVGSRMGECGMIRRFHGGRGGYGDDPFVWLEPLDSEQPLGYYQASELSVDGMPLSALNEREA